MSSQAPQPTAAASSGSETRHDTRVVSRRPSPLWSFGATVVDIALTGVALLLINLPALRDGLFALQVQHGTQVLSEPLLNRAFLRAVVPVLDGVILFAFAIRLLTRLAGVRDWTLTLGLVARCLGGLVILYVLAQPAIFAISRSVPARPFAAGSMQAFAEHWGRVALGISLIFIVVGIIDQLVAIARWRRQHQAAGASAAAHGR